MDYLVCICRLHGHCVYLPLNLTRNEEDQIFLDDSFSQEKAEQAAIVAKVAKIEPVVRLARWLVIAATVFVIAYYVWDILLQLHILQ